MNLIRTNILLLVLLLGVLTAAWATRVDRARPGMEWMPDMQYSPAYDAYSPNPNFPDGRTLQTQPVGTIARGQQVFYFAATKEDAVRAGEELTSPIATGDSVALERGADLFETYCAMCHGPQGLGDGPVTKRGYPPPPSLLTGKSVQMKDGQLFHILTYGQGSMAPFVAQISPQDRWKAIAHVRDMQAKAPAVPSGEEVKDEPASDEPASDEPASDEPASDEPAPDEPASDEPAPDEPAPGK